MAQRVEVPFEPPIRRVVWAGGEDVAAAMVYLFVMLPRYVLKTVLCQQLVVFLRAVVCTYFLFFRKVPTYKKLGRARRKVIWYDVL